MLFDFVVKLIPIKSGMAVAFIEAAEDLPMFPDSIAKPPAIAPLSVIPELQ